MPVGIDLKLFLEGCVGKFLTKRKIAFVGNGKISL
jgi:hypothetical protein